MFDGKSRLVQGKSVPNNKTRPGVPGQKLAAVKRFDSDGVLSRVRGVK